jgi:hypothetical protein
MNPYLNTPPTNLRRVLESEKDPKKRKQMSDALNAWRVTIPGPFRKGDKSMDKQAVARELVAVAKELVGGPIDVVVRDVKTGDVVMQMNATKFMSIARKLPGVSRNSFLPDMVKIYNKTFGRRNGLVAETSLT